MQSEVTSTVAGQVTRFYADCIRHDADGNLVKKSDAAGRLMIVNGIPSAALRAGFEDIPATNESRDAMRCVSTHVSGRPRVAHRP